MARPIKETPILMGKDALASNFDVPHSKTRHWVDFT